MPVRLYAPTQAAAWLKTAGFDVLGLANNHSLDAGPDGLHQTADLLQEAGVAVVGAGATSEQALAAYTFTHNGVSLAILSVNAIPIPPDHALPEGQSAQDGWDVARWEREAVLRAVSAASQQAEAVIVSIHWGYEYQFQPDPAQMRYAEWLFEAGADVVLGHHPHVVQPPVVFTRPDGRTVLAAYSLGNFVFDQGGRGHRSGTGTAHGVRQAGLARRPGTGSSGGNTTEADPAHLYPIHKGRGADHPHRTKRFWVSL